MILDFGLNCPTDDRTSADEYQNEMLELDYHPESFELRALDPSHPLGCFYPMGANIVKSSLATDDRTSVDKFQNKNLWLLYHPRAQTESTINEIAIYYTNYRLTFQKTRRTE